KCPDGVEKKKNIFTSIVATLENEPAGKTIYSLLDKRLLDMRLQEEEVDPVNTKLNYLEYGIMLAEEEAFQATWLELCHHAQRYLDMICQLLQFDATLRAQAFLQRTDIFAKFTSQAFSIWRCKKVNATLIHWDYKVGNVCHKCLPVRIDK
uniref:Uncharacterized protein n=1 Tax=Romanomermis culicivorax TaxID=13658 RepID=A0A915I573_ROMCU